MKKFLSLVLALVLTMSLVVVPANADGEGEGAETSVTVTGVTLSDPPATLFVDGTTTLTATVAPDNATNKNVSWTTSNASVATVDDSGKASWGKFKKAVSYKSVVILYDASKRAIILPVEQLGDNYGPVVDLIYSHMPAPSVRIRRADAKR